MDKRLKVVTAQVNEFTASGVRLLKYYIQDAIYNGQKTLPIVIDSCGGEVYSALAMIDALKASTKALVSLLNLPPQSLAIISIFLVSLKHEQPEAVRTK